MDDWDQLISSVVHNNNHDDDIGDISVPLLLSRNISLASFTGSSSAITMMMTDEEEDDLDAVLDALGGGVSSSSSIVNDDDDEEEGGNNSPTALSYSSSDDTACHFSSESSDYDASSTTGCSTTKKRKTSSTKTTKRASGAGLSAQEKRELRKLRNRELAAESRKRKNDEMDRLKQENSELKAKIAELEKKLKPVTTVLASKRTRLGTSAAVASLAAFVVADCEGLHRSQTASVLLTALDSWDGGAGRMISSSIVTMLVATVCLFFLANFVFRLVKSSLVVPLLLIKSESSSKMSAGGLIPRRVQSFTTISNSV